MRVLVKVGLVGISPSHEPTAADIRLIDRLVRHITLTSAFTPHLPSQFVRQLGAIARIVRNDPVTHSGSEYARDDPMNHTDRARRAAQSIA